MNYIYKLGINGTSGDEKYPIRIGLFPEEKNYEALVFLSKGTNKELYEYLFNILELKMQDEKIYWSIEPLTFHSNYEVTDVSCDVWGKNFTMPTSELLNFLEEKLFFRMLMRKRVIATEIINLGLDDFFSEKNRNNIAFDKANKIMITKKIFSIEINISITESDYLKGKDYFFNKIEFFDESMFVNLTT